MMKNIIKIFAILICAFPKIGNAQINLVLNPDFELYSSCPSWVDEIKFATYWNGLDSNWSPTDTTSPPPGLPDYINVCSSSPNTTCPSNMRFFHNPHSGNGMAQVQMYYNETDTLATIKRDFLQGRLKNHLIAGHQYCVSFFTVLEQSSAFAVDHIGSFLDDGSIDTTSHSGWPQPTHIPQIMSTSILTDTLNWIRIRGSFIANGMERYITIGNLYTAANTDTVWEHFNLGVLLGNHIISLYLIDDVSVIDLATVANAGHDTMLLNIGDSCWVGNHDGYLPCKWYKNGVLIDSNVAGFWAHPAASCYYVMALDVCGTVTTDTMKIQVGNVGLVDVGAFNEDVRVFPNPAISEVRVLGLLQDAHYQLQTVDGSILKEGILKKESGEISVKELPSGIYILVLYNDSGERIVGKLIRS